MPGSVDITDSNPNNLQSILGGIFRGMTNNKSSAGLPPDTNVRANNPNTYRWIGAPAGDQNNPPITTEQTQQPALAWFRGSAGTAFAYTQPTVTDIPNALSQPTPDTSVAFTNQASSIGSLVQSHPSSVPTGNWQTQGLGMNPTNAEHFREYFANQIGTRHLLPTPNAASVLTAVQSQNNMSADGSVDVRNLRYSITAANAKGYQPLQNFFAPNYPGLS